MTSSPVASSPRRRPLATLVLALSSVLVTLLGLETAFRLAGVSVGTVQINRETVRRSDNPRLRFDLRPNGRARAEVVYRVNAEGLRGPETTVEKPAGTRRIAVLGDSIAFGYWVAEQDAFPAQLQQLLSAGGGGPVEVLNFGVPGYNLEQEIETLRAKALAFAPDAVVVAFCLNDLEGVFSYELGLVQDRAARRGTLLGRVRDELLGHSLLFSWVEYRLSEMEARRRFVKVKNPLDGPLYAEAVSQQRTALDARFAVLQALVAARGIPAFVLVFPVLGSGFGESYPYHALHEAIAGAARAHGIGVVDLRECYAGYRLRDLRVDVVHPSPLGHRVAAHALRDGLCASGWGCAAGTAGGCRAYDAKKFANVRGY
jgi:lysophospholipase L1-like esterase